MNQLIDQVDIDGPGTPTTRELVRTGITSPDQSLVLTQPFREFAQWVFGPQGLPSLQVLAYGDFSPEGRPIRANFLLGRSKEGALDEGYRKITSNERLHKDILNKYGNALASCPSGCRL